MSSVGRGGLLHSSYYRRKFAGFLGGADAPDVAWQSHPGLRPLRTIAMPGTRLEIAELFVEHEVHAVIELDQITIGIVVVDRHVVAGPVPYRSPEDLEFVASEQIAGLMHVRGVAQFERQMVDARLRAACKIHRVMFGAATQEDEIFLDPVGDTEAEK